MAWGKYFGTNPDTTKERPQPELTILTANSIQSYYYIVILLEYITSVLELYNTFCLMKRTEEKCSLH